MTMTKKVHRQGEVLAVGFPSLSKLSPGFHSLGFVTSDNIYTEEGFAYTLL